MNKSEFGVTKVNRVMNGKKLKRASGSSPNRTKIPYEGC